MNVIVRMFMKTRCLDSGIESIQDIVSKTRERQMGMQKVELGALQVLLPIVAYATLLQPGDRLSPNL